MQPHFHSCGYSWLVVYWQANGKLETPLGIPKWETCAVTRDPDYSPQAVAEQAVGLLLILNRKIQVGKRPAILAGNHL
jgi:hypothetical protein